MRTVYGSKRLLTNNQIVVAGVLALTPIGILGIPDFMVHRNKKAIIHLIISLGASLLLPIAIAIANSIPSASSPNVAPTETILPEVQAILYIYAAIQLGNYIWSAFEGGWTLGHIEDVRARAN